MFRWRTSRRRQHRRGWPSQSRRTRSQAAHASSCERKATWNLNVVGTRFSDVHRNVEMQTCLKGDRSYRCKNA